MICKALEKEVSFLFEFNKLWSSGQLICHRIGRHIMWCLHQPLVRLCCDLFLALGPFGFSSVVVPFFLQWVFSFVPERKAKNNNNLDYFKMVKVLWYYKF
jgi:hypothetical protein